MRRSKKIEWNAAVIIVFLFLFASLALLTTALEYSFMFFGMSFIALMVVSALNHSLRTIKSELVKGIDPDGIPHAWNEIKPYRKEFLEVVCIWIQSKVSTYDENSILNMLEALTCIALSEREWMQLHKACITSVNCTDFCLIQLSQRCEV